MCFDTLKDTLGFAIQSSLLVNCFAFGIATLMLTMTIRSTNIGYKGKSYYREIK